MLFKCYMAEYGGYVIGRLGSHRPVSHHSILYARIKVHSHASHTPLSCALSGICHASQASMCNLRRMSHVLNSLKIPIYGNFSGASRHHRALLPPRHRSQQLLCTIHHVSHARCIVTFTCAYSIFITCFFQNQYCVRLRNIL